MAVLFGCVVEYDEQRRRWRGLVEQGVLSALDSAIGCRRFWHCRTGDPVSCFSGDHGGVSLRAGLAVVVVPLFIAMSAITALAIGLWLTALNVKYRDVGQAIPFVVQAWMWLCPIVYSSNSVPEHLRMVYGLNPMVGVIEGFRWSLLGTGSPDWNMMAVSFSVVFVLLIGGLYYFRRTEDTFADII